MSPLILGYLCNTSLSLGAAAQSSVGTHPAGSEIGAGDSGRVPQLHSRYNPKPSPPLQQQQLQQRHASGDARLSGSDGRGAAGGGAAADAPRERYNRTLDDRMKELSLLQPNPRGTGGKR